MKRKYALAALILAAAASALPRNALATRCNRTIRVGVYRIASPVVFLSHQWLGHFNPDPQGIHYRAMVRAVTSTAERASVPLNRVRVSVAEHAGAAVAAAVPGRVLGIDRAVDAGRHRRRLGADVPRVSPSPSYLIVAPSSFPLSSPQVITLLFNLSR